MPFAKGTIELDHFLSIRYAHGDLYKHLAIDSSTDPDDRYSTYTFTSVLGVMSDDFFRFFKKSYREYMLKKHLYHLYPVCVVCTIHAIKHAILASLTISFDQVCSYIRSLNK